MSRRKMRSGFDQVSEFDRERIVPIEIMDYLSGKSVVILDETKQLVCANHSTPFTAEWSVRKTSIALSTLDAEPQMSPPPMGLATAIFQQDNARPHVVRIVQRFFVNHQIELLPWPARSLDLSPIENMWFMVAQRLTQITPPAATSDQLWQHAEASWSAVPQEHTSKVSLNQCRGVWQR
ncbi:transposable element Tcb1 transposase [Trichonephila clavipes]|nr:transposable element Tcb1 transposase [Trichonephila clavipes]